MENNKLSFTNEKPFIEENLKPNQYLRITKIISQNDLTFALSPSLGFKVTSGKDNLDVRSFVGLLNNNQRNAFVIEKVLNYYPTQGGNIRIEIQNPLPERQFNIVMLCTIENT